MKFGNKLYHFMYKSCFKLLFLSLIQTMASVNHNEGGQVEKSGKEPSGHSSEALEKVKRRVRFQIQIYCHKNRNVYMVSLSMGI